MIAYTNISPVVPNFNDVAESAATTDSDVGLIIRIARQDKAAFSAFYDRHAPQALGLALRMLADRAASEDATQEAFWRVWQNARRFNVNAGNPRAWLLTIVQRLCIDHLRGGKRIGLELDAHDADGEPIDLVDEAQDVHEHAELQINGHRVRAALAELDGQVRDVLELAYFQGLTHREIASRLQQPLGTVHSRVLQGMAALKRQLSGAFAG